MRMRALAISGSLRFQSTNTVLLEALEKLAPVEIEVELFRELDQIPPFNPDLEVKNEAGPVAQFRAQLRLADAVIFSTPEYAHGVPGALKNALDWVVGSGELSGKPVVLVNASPRGIYAQASLKEILRTMDATLLHNAEVTIDLSGKTLTPFEITQNAESSSSLVTSLRTLADFVSTAKPTQR